MQALVLLPVEFDGRRRKQDEIIDLPADAPSVMREELAARARQGVVRILRNDPPIETRDMHPEPGRRGYKKRA